MTTLKENTELQSKVDEDEDDIDTLTEKNRQLVKQVCQSCLLSLHIKICGTGRRERVSSMCHEGVPRLVFSFPETCSQSQTRRAFTFRDSSVSAIFRID